MIDEKLKDWATPRQVEFIDAVNRTGSFRKAAKRLGVRHDNVRASIRRLEKVAATKGYSPEHDLVHVVAEPFVAKGHSTYYNEDGRPTQQWVKTRLDDQAYLELLREAAASFAEGVGPITPAPPISGRDTDIIPWVQIGDAHLGMIAYETETGQAFDLDIAERELCAAISTLIDETGEHERIVINDLGDFSHYDNMKAVTARSGHQLDADGRLPKMIRVYSRVMRFIVDKALEKANVVDVIVNRGNHSEVNDVWMAELLRVGYGHTGRVNVLNNDSLFIGYRMGRTFVMTHHSHACKPTQLAHVMATDFHQDWGEAEYRYIDIGHIHHKMQSKEHPGVVVESWNQLAAPDNHAHEGGWRSRQSISVVDRSRTYGEVGRRVLPIRRVRDLIGTATLPRRAFAA